MRNDINKWLKTSLCAAALAALSVGCSSPNSAGTDQMPKPASAGATGIQWPDQFARGTGTTQTTAPVTTQAALAPAPAPAPRAAGYSAADITGGPVKLTKRVPSQVALGEEYCYELTIVASEDVSGVLVTDTVPEGASYVSSQPQAQKDGSKLSWQLPGMKKAETTSIRICLKADREGELTSCATVTAVPVICVTTLVGKPVLTIEKSGPATAQLGADVAYSIVVANKGTFIARGVVVTDNVPDGLTHASGQKQVVTQVGDLAPGQSKTIPISLKAAARGKHCNEAVATSSNAAKVSDDACTTVLRPGLDIAKEGTKDQIIGRNADYDIVVSNTGDTELTNLKVTDTAPTGTSIVTAEGAVIAGNTATWTVASLPAGQKKAFKVRLTSKVGGNLCNIVTVADAQGLSDRAEACTMWKGVAGVLLEVVDDPDPIAVGETTTYTVRVTNQGFANITEITLSAEFDEEANPVSASQGTLSGKKVAFPNTAVLAPKQSITYTVVVRGITPGDARNRVTLNAAELKTPVVEEESTTVY